MTVLQQLLNEHVLDSKNTDKMFRLAREYDKLGQGSGAITLYMRAADLEEDNVFLQYKCMILSARICERQTNRDYTMLGFLQHAASLMPARPEVHYHLSKYYEKKADWRQCLIHAQLGLINSELNSPELGYPGAYALEYEKALSSWCISGTDVCREDVFRLVHSIRMDELHESKSLGLLNTVGYPHAIKYNKSALDQLKVKFKGVETIDRNFSQHMQDMFVLTMLDGKRDGFYLEFGSGEPFLHNNTALLETKFNWKGLSLDNRDIPCYNFNAERRNTVLNVDATTIDYKQFFKEHSIPKVIDYLQLDIDEPTLSVLYKLPLDDHKFRVITFEHDIYAQGPEVRDAARKYLTDNGYVLFVNDLAFNPTTPYEDWYVHPDLVSTTNKQPGDSTVNFVWDYMMRNKNG